LDLVCGAVAECRDGIKSFFLIALICIKKCWIPSSETANQGPEKGGLIPV